MKLLVIRMSSLGDVLLSTAFLENLPAHVQVDWVVASEFAFVLKDHPRIHQLIVFDKKTGLQGWLELIRKIDEEKYDRVVDLHLTLRTRIARLYLQWLRIKNARIGQTKTYKISKDRFRFFAYTVFKHALPVALRPVPFWIRYAKLAQKIFPSLTGEVAPPSYLPILQKRKSEAPEILKRYGLEDKKYYAVMPASRWRSKEWGTEKFAELCVDLKKTSKILLLGRANEPACQELIEKLNQKGISFQSALDEKDFEVTALLLHHALAFVGGDTGLAHLTEAVNTPAVVIFGPTRPDLGFGPRREDSVSVFSETLCAPCSKDGSICYRFFGRYACLKRITVNQVQNAVQKAGQKR